MNPTEADLIARVLVHDDRNAFGELVRRHQSAVRRFLRQQLSGDAAAADDLAQDTFIHAYQSLERFRGEASFTTWLLGIAHNLSRNTRRKRHEISRPPADPIFESGVPSGQRTTDLKTDLTAALAHLDPDEQTALHLFYREGLPHPEIAQITGWPLGTVKTHLARGKEQLRHLLPAWNPHL